MGERGEELGEEEGKGSHEGGRWESWDKGGNERLSVGRKSKEKEEGKKFKNKKEKRVFIKLKKSFHFLIFKFVLKIDVIKYY